MGKRSREQGFTLIEVLIVVAIFGILAAVAIIAYRSYVAKARKSEVFSMIAAIKSAQEAYKAERSHYVSTGTSEQDYYPQLGSNEPTLKVWNPASDGRAAWRDLSVSVPKDKLYCGYVVISGVAGSLQGAGPRGQTLFDNKAPNRPWYYIRAECDFDGKGKPNATFETTFDSEIVYVDNETR